MARETRVIYGPTPHALGDGELPEHAWRIDAERFLLKLPGSHYFYYRKHEGIVIERGAGADLSSEPLWLGGTLYAAIAVLNGLVPIHASAVVHRGRVFAFTGPSGAGKSTLIAALGRLGLPMMCDDTLVLDLSAPDAIGCLPGHKRLKLTAQALKLARADPQERVSPQVEKFYAAPHSGSFAEPLPLERLVFLERGEGPALTPVAGAQRLARLIDDHYTTELVAASLGHDRQALFAHFTALAARIAMARFVRPWDAARFDAGATLAARYVRGEAPGDPRIDV